MPKFVFGVYIRIIIFEILVASIIRRVNVDYINLAGVSVGQFGKGRKIVSLDYNVVWRLRVIRYYWVDFIVIALYEDGKLVTQTIFDVLRLFFPNKAILLVATQQVEQRGLFLVFETFKGLYFSCQFCFVHGTSDSRSLEQNVAEYPNCDGLTKKVWVSVPLLPFAHLGGTNSLTSEWVMQKPTPI